MNYFKKITIAAAFAFSLGISAQQQSHAWKEASAAGYTYKYVTNDPAGARFYTLKNGLTVILSPSKKEPRVQAFVATKAGSKTDPADHTGLAHYLEHMLFKGTNKFGTLDWAKEKPLLDQITALYETYNKTTDDAKRKEIYHQIDQVSGQAAHYAIANEYDKMMAAMGARGTNAFTSFEETVYTDDVPSNALDRYLTVQSERFREPVLRLFHTELEAVYEEKNRSLDNDGSKSFEAMFAALFPDNNYGKQTTIGTVHDLKNPSLTAIENYYHTFYVPNNMGVILAGDFNPDEVIAKIDQAFSYMQPKAIPTYNAGGGFTITQPIVKEVIGPNPENVMIGYRFPGANTKDAQILQLVGEMLTNGQAGLIDLDLVKKQKLLGANAFAYALKDDSALLLTGRPSEGQSLDKVRALLLAEIAKLRNGDFSEDLVQSIVNNEKKDIIQTSESYTARANQLMDEFTSGVDHANATNFVNEISTISKQDIVGFANKYLKDNNYAIVYKRKGVDNSIVKVDKPIITPVEVNRDAQSPFLLEINNMPEKAIQPVWVDYNKDIAKGKLGQAEVLSVKNNDNSLFNLYYYFDTGKYSNKLLPIAAGYLEFLGTNSKSADQFSKDFYKLASSFRVITGNEQTYISLDGLNENFGQAVSLLEDLIRHAKPDQAALEAYKTNLKKGRQNAKENKSAIMAGLRSYAQYGAQNPFNNVLSDAELDALKAEDLVNILHSLFNYQHKVLYYGPQTNAQLVAALKPLHKLNSKLLALPASKVYKSVVNTSNKVLFAPYDMVQAEVNWVRNADKYNAAIMPTVNLFNEYFGGGMGSLVFQTIRESKALAYSTYAFFSPANKISDDNVVNAYVGTQADKFDDATSAMNALLNDLPQSDKLFQVSKESVMKKLATGRITQSSILFNYLSAQRLGSKVDMRKAVYDQIPRLTFADLQNFHTKEMKNKNYTYCVVASLDKVPFAKMQALGTVQQLNLKEIFGY